MKRDIDLIRSLLKEIEATPAGGDWEPGTYEGHDGESVLEHMRLLVDADYITGEVDCLVDGTGYYCGIRLTWNGHEFLSATKNPAIWAKAREKLMDSTVSFTVPVVLEWLKKQVQDTFL